MTPIVESAEDLIRKHAPEVAEQIRKAAQDAGAMKSGITPQHTDILGKIFNMPAITRLREHFYNAQVAGFQ